MTEVSELLDKTENKSPVVKTSCKDCMFSTWKDSEQVGCQFGRLKKFGSAAKKVGAHYEIDRFCNRCRHTKYQDRYQDPLKEVYVETRPTVDLVVLLDDFQESRFYRFVQHYNDLIFSPASINILTNGKRQPIVDILENNSKIPYTVTRFLSDLTNLEKIDDVVPKLKGQYYTVLDNYYLPLRDFIQRLDYQVNELLRRVSLVEPVIENNMLTVQRRTHTALGGNYNFPIQQKIHEVCEEEGSMELITSWKKI